MCCNRLRALRHAVVARARARNSHVVGSIGSAGVDQEICLRPSGQLKLGSALTIAPAPGPNLAWNNQLAADGTVRVFSTVPVNLAVTVLNMNALTLSWPVDHTGWRLQTQTNTVTVGLGTNWLDVSGSMQTNQMTAPVDPENGAVFFRLIYN